MSHPLFSSPRAKTAAQTRMTRARTTMEAVKELIVTHQLQPGDPLPTEAELIAQLGVSRSSVREALRQLQALEIVEVKHGSGAFVGSLSMQPFIQAMMLRYWIDPDSVEALRQLISLRKILDHGIACELVAVFQGTDNPELHRIVDAMEKKALKGRSFAKEDIAFHSGLLSRLNNLLVQQIVAAMWEIHTQVADSLAESPTDLIVRTAQAHRDILHALEAGDIDAYMEAVNQHYAPLEEILDL